MLDRNNDGAATEVNVQIPLESMKSTFLEMVYRADGPEPPETVMAKGTGFFYQVDGKDFLVTARHNVTGWDIERDKPLSSHGVSPTHIRVGFWSPPPPGGKYDLTRPMRISLYQFELLDGEGHDAQPRWLEHPQLGRKMDVVALPLRPPNSDVALYLPWTPKKSADLWVTQDLAIVGYPYGLNSNNLPIWVRGSIASEPSLLYVKDDEPLPLLLVDARTRQGQSGSPVVIFRRPLTVLGTATGQVQITKGTQSSLIGVYSGRVNSESDLGFVWRMGAVEEICRNGSSGTPEPQPAK